MDTILKLYQKENFDKLQTEVNKLSIKELKNLIKEETLLKEIFGEIFKGILVGKLNFIFANSKIPGCSLSTF